MVIMKKEKKEDSRVTAKFSKSPQKGIVISDKMDKTLVVAVNTLKEHPKYKKRYVSSKKYKVHDEKNEYVIGDKVEFEACRPMSSGKKWKVKKGDK
jgi:small subunit ribosomal protein S17